MSFILGLLLGWLLRDRTPGIRSYVELKPGSEKVGGVFRRYGMVHKEISNG